MKSKVKGNIHQDIKEMEKRYQGMWHETMLANCLQKDINHRICNGTKGEI